MDGQEPKQRPRSAAASYPAARKVLRTGTYLLTHCPFCGREMVDGDWIRFLVTSGRGVEGELLLSARFNVFEQKATIPLKAGDQVEDFLCPHCRGSLLDDGCTCETCGSPAVRIRVSAVCREITLLLCSRYGCHWHGVPESDRRRLILEDQE